jgi:serine/threonine protein kinase
MDICAVGIVAYEMLTGHPPFDGMTPQQRLAAQVTQTPMPVAAAGPSRWPASLVEQTHDRRRGASGERPDSLTFRPPEPATVRGWLTRWCRGVVGEGAQV